MKENLNIMMSLMKLDIGGAETHVVELAKELKRKGHNIVVTSNGGAYVKELEEAGIKHYIVPLQNKNPLNVIKSIRLLKKIIIDEKIDIVHSHARIPSFILGKLYKKMKFPFVTTAHWVFDTRFGLKYITDWGEKTVAVSEDIKTYLMDNYKIPESDIRVTINGIDTEKFSPDTDDSEVRKELGLAADDRAIVYVSRLDESRSLVAKQLIEVTPVLDKTVNNLRVVIVGGGDDYENVAAMAEKANKEIGRECVVLTGGRTDINRLVAPAELFVGVSRAALEAMSAEKPVIIAGNEGYIGLFDEDKLKVGIDTNFCCRGCAESTASVLAEDILRFFEMEKSEREHLAKYGREIIKREYSVERMAADSMKVYEWALSKNKEMLISGYYGFKNSGDDALLMAILKDIKRFKESPNIVVLSANPRETEKNYRVKAINRLNPFAVIRHMNKADMLISGGGTLIQDATSTKSLIYYLSVIRLAVRKHLKVMLYSNGIGPLSSGRNIERAKRVLNKTDVITLRDPEAMEVLKSIGVTKPKIKVSADPVLGMDVADREYGRELLREMNLPTEKVLGVSVRKTKEANAAFERAMAEMCDYAAEKYGYNIVFVPMQANRDEFISRSIMSKMKAPSAMVEKRLNVNDTISLVSAMDICVGMRLHSLIYAASGGVPLIGIAYDPKIKSFMKYIGHDMCIDMKSADAKSLCCAIDSCVENYSEIKCGLSARYAELKEKAMENGRIAVELYEKEVEAFENGR